MAFCTKSFNFKSSDDSDKVIQVACLALTEEKYVIDQKSIRSPKRNVPGFSAKRKMGLTTYASFADIDIVTYDYYYDITITIYSKIYCLSQENLHKKCIANIEKCCRSNMIEYDHEMFLLAKKTRDLLLNNTQSTEQTPQPMVTCNYCTASFTAPTDNKCPNCNAPI